MAQPLRVLRESMKLCCLIQNIHIFSQLLCCLTCTLIITPRFDLKIFMNKPPSATINGSNLENQFYLMLFYWENEVNIALYWINSNLRISLTCVKITKGLWAHFQTINTMFIIYHVYRHSFVNYGGLNDYMYIVFRKRTN